MDWLLPRQPQIEAALATRHLAEGTLALYDLTSTSVEGQTCPLAKFGHSRDGKKGTLQIVFGLICNAEGCPVAVEVFAGTTADPATLALQLQNLRDRFHVRRVVVVGERGVLTEARIREEWQAVAGRDWITALRGPALRTRVEAGTLDLEHFAETALFACPAPTDPAERLIACRHPALAEERARKREARWQATEREREPIRQATQRAKRRLTGQAKLAFRGGKVRNRVKMGKPCRLEITDAALLYSRDTASIMAEAALDGLYVLRTSGPLALRSTASTVHASTRLSTVARALRSLTTVALHVRPSGHRLAERVRAHVCRCMLAYDVAWHMRQALAPLLCDDDNKAAGEARRTSGVAPAQRSPRAQRQARTTQTDEGMPGHSVQTLLDDLATVTTNRVRFVQSNTETTF
jgi:hypothetical protein